MTLNPNSKFLDDILLNHANNKDIESKEDLVDLINELYKLCEDQWKPKIILGETTKKELKVHLDRTFNSWDSFIRRLPKEVPRLLPILKLLEDGSYRNAFLKNEITGEAYKDL